MTSPTRNNPDFYRSIAPSQARYEPTIAETLLEALTGKYAQFTFDRQREILTKLANRIKQMENTYEHQF